MEIRNVSTVQNNNPAFGMAVLKAVKPEDAARFVTDVTKDVYISSKQMDKVVKGIMERAAKNTQFDIQPFVSKLNVDGKQQDVVCYHLIPKTEDAKRIMEVQKMKDVITTRFYTPTEEFNQRAAKRLEGKKGLGKFFARTVNFYDGFKTTISFVRHPEQLMDSRLRYAVQYAEDCEAAVVNRLKSEKLVNELLG